MEDEIRGRREGHLGREDRGARRGGRGTKAVSARPLPRRGGRRRRARLSKWGEGRVGDVRVLAAETPASKERAREKERDGELGSATLARHVRAHLQAHSQAPVFQKVQHLSSV